MIDRTPRERRVGRVWLLPGTTNHDCVTRRVADDAFLDSSVYSRANEALCAFRSSDRAGRRSCSFGRQCATHDGSTGVPGARATYGVLPLGEIPTRYRHHVP